MNFSDVIRPLENMDDEPEDDFPECNWCYREDCEFCQSLCESCGMMPCLCEPEDSYEED